MTDFCLVPEMKKYKSPGRSERLLWVELCHPQNLYVVVLTSKPLECDLIWTQGC